MKIKEVIQNKNVMYTLGQGFSTFFQISGSLAGLGRGLVFKILKVCRRAVMLLLVKCYDIKMVKLPGCFYIGVPVCNKPTKKK